MFCHQFKFDFIIIGWTYHKCQFHSSERNIHSKLENTNKSFFLTITLMNIRNAALEKERCIIIRSLYLLADYPKNMSFCQSILCLIVYLILAIENVKVFGIANLLLRSKSAPFDTFFKATFFIAFVSYNFLRNRVTNTSKCIWHSNTIVYHCNIYIHLYLTTFYFRCIQDNPVACKLYIYEKIGKSYCPVRL